MEVNVPSKIHREKKPCLIINHCCNFRSSPDVNQYMSANTSHETTTCDELDNPDASRHKRSAARRRR